MTYRARGDDGHTWSPRRTSVFTPSQLRTAARRLTHRRGFISALDSSPSHRSTRHLPSFFIASLSSANATLSRLRRSRRDSVYRPFCAHKPYFIIYAFHAASLSSMMQQMGVTGTRHGGISQYQRCAVLHGRPPRSNISMHSRAGVQEILEQPRRLRAGHRIFFAPKMHDGWAYRGPSRY